MEALQRGRPERTSPGSCELGSWIKGLLDLQPDLALESRHLVLQDGSMTENIGDSSGFCARICSRSTTVALESAARKQHAVVGEKLAYSTRLFPSEAFCLQKGLSWGLRFWVFSRPMVYII